LSLHSLESTRWVLYTTAWCIVLITFDMLFPRASPSRLANTVLRPSISRSTIASGSN
jgi:hypothetical protein